MIEFILVVNGICILTIACFLIFLMFFMIRAWDYFIGKTCNENEFDVE